MQISRIRLTCRPLSEACVTCKTLGLPTQTMFLSVTREFNPSCGRLLSKLNVCPSRLPRRQQGSFAPRELLRFFTTMSPSDFRTDPSSVMDSQRKLVVEPPSERTSQVPRLICRCPLSPTTPESPIAAIARCFTTGIGFIISGRLTAPCMRNEAESGSLALRLTPSSCGASTARLLRQPPARLHGERALTMFSTFQLKRSTRLRLAHQRARRPQRQGF
jgi:hypothetical protein